jgi:hypothetical protein
MSLRSLAENVTVRTNATVPVINPNCIDRREHTGSNQVTASVCVHVTTANVPTRTNPIVHISSPMSLRQPDVADPRTRNALASPKTPYSSTHHVQVAAAIAARVKRRPFNRRINQSSSANINSKLGADRSGQTLKMRAKILMCSANSRRVRSCNSGFSGLYREWLIPDSRGSHRPVRGIPLGVVQ